MEQKEILKTGTFVSGGVGESGRRRFFRVPARKTARPKRKRMSGGSAFLLARLGVCAAAFLAVLGLKMAGKTDILKSVGGTAESGSGTGASDGSLGRLKFVELPSIVEVFARSDRAVLPVKVLSFEIGEEESGLTIITSYGSEVVSPAAGRVKAVGEDPALGRYVSVIADGDVEFTLYGFDEIAVEDGQPVSQRQKLGTLKGASLMLETREGGRPINPAELLDLGGAN